MDKAERILLVWDREPPRFFPMAPHAGRCHRHHRAGTVPAGLYPDTAENTKRLY